MSPTARRPLVVAVLLALAAASLPAQDTRAAVESAPTSRVYRPPGRTYPMPGRDMGELPVAEWASPAALKDFGVDLAKRLLPNDAGAVWIGVLTMLLVGAAWRPFRAGRNLECVLLLALAPFYVHLIDRQSTLDDAPSTRGAYVICFTAIYLLTAWWWLRGLVGSRAAPPAAPPSDEHGPRRPVKTIALSLVLLNAFLIAARPPDDCGHYTNLGAQRMLERKSWPYGDEKLLGGAAATYGPVLYVVNAGVLALRPDATPNPPDALPDKAFGYVNPPMWAAKTVVALFHGAALLALFLIGRRLRDAATGWTLVALYAGSPYVLGLGGEATSVTGLGYVSHIAPAATILLAFAALPAPFLAGVLLNVAIGTGYFPAFFWPAWSAYFGTRNKGDGVKFQLGFFGAGAVLIAALWFGTERAGGRNPIELFLEGSIAHQEAPDQYGSSTLSFFGAHPAAKATIRAPLFGEKARMVTPVFLLAAGFSLAGFWLGRRRTPAQLAFLTASTIACVQLWKHHASGTYVEWYYPLLLIGVFANAPEKPKDERPPEPAAPIPAHA
jgi:hypothetical protein